MEIKISVEGKAHYCAWIGEAKPERVQQVVLELIEAVKRKEGK